MKPNGWTVFYGSSSIRENEVTNGKPWSSEVWNNGSEEEMMSSGNRTGSNDKVHTLEPNNFHYYSHCLPTLYKVVW